MSINCEQDNNCPFLFQCVNNFCQHEGIFPLTAYNVCIYLIIPFGIMLCNVGGLSAGIYKVPILMDLLNYPVNIATTLSYPIVTGASLGNFIQLIPKRNPYTDTSLVDYNLVLILIPCVIFGSTLGVIIVQFIPLLYQDIILLVVFILFTIFFIKQYLSIRPPEPEEEKLFAEMQPSQDKSEVSLEKSEYFTRQKQDGNSYDSSSIKVEASGGRTQSLHSQLDRHLEYEKTNHWQDILTSLAVFLVFQVLSLFCQGKLYYFNNCSWIFAVCFTFLVLVIIGYVILVYHLIQRRLKYYKEIGYKYRVKLNKTDNFIIIVLGGFIGGFLQGIIGLGSGNTMVAAMLVVGVDATVTAATSGYQIFFIGMASLVEALAQKQISWVDAGFLFGISFVFGGLLTLLLYHLLKDKKNVQKTLLIIIVALCVLCIVGIIPSVFLTAHNFGWPYLLHLNGSICD